MSIIHGIDAEGNKMAFRVDGLGNIRVTSGSATAELNTASIKNLSYSGTSANFALSDISATAGDTLRVYAPTDCYIEFGSSAPTADSNSLYFAAGTEFLKVPASATYMAIVRVTSDGTANITRMG